MNYLDVINEGLIHEVFDSEHIREVSEDLRSGKVVARIFYPPDEIAAMWENRPNAPQMGIRIVGDELMFRCTCREFKRETLCEHIAALLVAWARERSTFTIVNEEGEMEDFDDDEYDEDEEDLFPMEEDLFRSGIPGRRNVPAPRHTAREPVYDPVADYHRILSELTLPELREMARIRGVPISGLRKEPILDTLSKELARPEKIAEDWPKLSANARLVAGLISFVGPQMYPTQLKKLVQQAGLKGEKAFDEALEELRHFGLLNVTSYGMIQYPAVLPLWLPPDPDFLSISVLNPAGLREQAAPEPRAFYQSLLRIVMQLQPDGDRYLVRSHEREETLLKKMPFLRGWPLDIEGLELINRNPYPLQAIRQRGVRVIPQPTLLASDALMKLANATELPSAEVDFVLRLITGPDAKALKAGKPLNLQQNFLIRMVQGDTLDVVKEMFAYYASIQDWSELDFLLAQSKKFQLVINDHTGRQYSWVISFLAGLRNAVLMLMRRLPGGRWYAVDDLMEKLHALSLDESFSIFSSIGYFEIDGQKAHLNEPGDQKTILRAFLEAMLTRPLYWQGAVDLGWKGDRLAGFRLTALGMALLAQSRDYQLPEPLPGAASLAFQADGGLKINLETVGGDLLALLTMLGGVETTREGAVVYRPNLLGAGRAFEAGWTSERILEALSKAAQQPAPQKLAEMLNRWWSNFGSIHMYQDVALIELGDDYALNELLAGTSLSKYLLYRFNARLVAIRPEGVEPLREELVKKGYTPRITV